MTFIVTLIALLIERFFDWTHLRQWHWFLTLERYMYRRFQGKSPYLVLAASILPLLLGILVIDLLIHNLLYGFVKLIFQLFLLIYCLGPQNLWADAFSRINGHDHDKDMSKPKNKKSNSTSDTTYSQSSRRHFLNTIFIEANRRVFTVIFWYVLIGPIGAVLYRTISLSSPAYPNQEISPQLSESAQRIEAALNWLPDRIVTIIFALGGHFVHALSCWRKKVLLGFGSNDVLLTECGIAALGIEDDDKIPNDGSAENHAINLLDRSFIIMLGLIAIVAVIL